MTAGRVGVNLLWMIPEVVGGSEQYTVRLLEAVAARGEHELVLFIRPDFVDHHPELSAATETLVAPGVGASRTARILLENTWLPTAQRRARVGLVHHPGGTIPWRSPAPTVLTVHDLQPLELPGNFARLKRQYLARALPRSVATATKITASSLYVARGLAARFDLAVDDVAVVPAGPGVVDEPPTDATIATVRNRYGIGDEYVIYPAITYGHKNHQVLLRAASLLDGVQIVFTGGAGDAEHAVARHVADNHLAPIVKRLGRVPGADLEALLSGAAALVFPSLYEGFGLPVVEAMARRIPVIVAASTCLPELVGEAGAVVAPRDPSAWAAAINRVVVDTDYADSLVEIGVGQAAMFTSVAGGERLAEAYDEVLQS